MDQDIYIYGYGNFIGQSPAITCGLGNLVFYGQTVTTPSGHSILINGPYRSTINIRHVYSEIGIYINGQSYSEVNIDRFESEGIFVEATDNSTGWLNIKSQYIECGILIKSDSGSMTINLDSQNVITYAPYMLDIDNQNEALYNVNMNKITCVGIVRSIGINTIINLHASHIHSRNTLANPVIVCRTSRVNLTYDVFSFTYLVPISFMIVVSERGVLNMQGIRTYNSDIAAGNDIGFIQVSSANYASVKCKFTELNITSQLIECSGGSEAYIDITDFSNTCLLPRSVSCIVNNAKCFVNVKKCIQFTQVSHK